MFAQAPINPLVIISATPEAEQKVNYDLPYPGLLPDSPLYVLRVIRDKIVGFLISSALKKAEFNLLQADKRLNAGVYLFNKGKSISQAVATISKAENYFYEAIVEVKRANNQGINTRSLTEKLLDASKKHQEIIVFLKERSKGNIKESLARERERVGGFEKQVSGLLSKKAK